jgi:hypothetical protein
MKKQKGERKCKAWLKSFDYPYIDCEEPQCNTNVQQTQKNKNNKRSVEPNWSVGHV